MSSVVQEKLKKFWIAEPDECFEEDMGPWSERAAWARYLGQRGKSNFSGVEIAILQLGLRG